MRAAVAIPGLALAAMLGLGPGPTAAAPGDFVLTSSSPEQAFANGDCPLCHEVPGVASAPRLESCADCHAWIREVAADPGKRAKAMEVFPLWERYERNTHSFLRVPSLEAAMARLDPEWVEGYLADPHDLRPGLPETMPRFALSEDERAAIAVAFAKARVEVPATDAPDPARVAEGAALFESRGCSGCHTFGALHTAASTDAPDLAHARERLDPDMAAAWIADPSAVSSDASMPSLGLKPTEVLAVRDYVLLADPAWTPAPALPTAIEPVDRPVGWAEVEERVFGRICVHCHMDPEQNGGRAGPGNAGGFGFEATGLALQTYEQVVAARQMLPDALMRRRHEAARDAVRPGQKPADLTRPDKPGMPLGLPPLSDEDLSLVLGWIAQDTPR